MKSLKRTTCAKKIAVGFNFIISHSEKWKVKFMKSILSIAAWRRFRFLILLPLCHGNYENLFIQVFAIHLLFSRCSKLLQQRMFYAFWQVLRSNGWISSRHAFYGLIATMQMRGETDCRWRKRKKKIDCRESASSSSIEFVSCFGVNRLCLLFNGNQSCAKFNFVMLIGDDCCARNET